MKKVYIALSLVLLIGLLFFIIDFSMTKTTTSSSANSSLDLEKHTSIQYIYPSINEIDILIFKKEEVFEVWINSDTATVPFYTSKLSLYNSEIGTRLYDSETYLPEGLYSILLDSIGQLTLNFPNELDQSKANADLRPPLQSIIQLSTDINSDYITFASYDYNFLKKLLSNTSLSKARVLIFPTDIRQNSFISYCNRCPSWIQEVYGQLRLEAKKFLKK